MKHESLISVTIFIPIVNHAYAQQYIWHNLIQTINNTSNIIIDKIHTHSLRGFLNDINDFIFGNYEYHVTFQIVIDANIDIIC